MRPFVLALATLMLVPWPAHAGGAPAAEPSLPALAFPPDPREALAGLARLDDARALPRIALGLAQAHGATLPSAEGAAGPGVWAIALASDDLTGDGRADAVEAGIELSTGLLRIDGIRGADGATAWSRAIPWTFDQLSVAASADATGDALADVLLLGWTLDSEGPDALGTHARYHWTLTLLSGADGATAWTRTYAGRLQASLASTATNVTVLAYAAGPASPGIVVDVYDVDLATRGLLLATSRGELIGPDGATIASRVLRERPDFGLLQPAGRLGGDATPDLVWEVDENVFLLRTCVFPALDGCLAQTALHLEAVDGAEGGTLWRATHERLATVAAIPARADLTGDGLDDLLTLRFGAGEHSLWSGALSGADGARLWDDRFGLAFAAGALDAGAGEDVLLVEVGHDGIDQRYTIRRLDGATGAERLATSPFLGHRPDARTRLLLAPDLDGDGARDLIVNHWYNEVGTNSTLLVESGRTGAPLLLEETSGHAFHVPVGDLDDDGVDDLARIELEWWRYPGMGLVVDGRSLAAGTLWRRAEAWPDFPGMLLTPAADLGAGAGDDLLLSIIREGGGTTSRIVALDGASGGAIWTHGAV